MLWYGTYILLLMKPNVNTYILDFCFGWVVVSMTLRMFVTLDFDFLSVFWTLWLYLFSANEKNVGCLLVYSDNDGIFISVLFNCLGIQHFSILDLFCPLFPHFYLFFLESHYFLILYMFCLFSLFYICLVYFSFSILYFSIFSLFFKSLFSILHAFNPDFHIVP